jgi:glycosyltransferase involved in cell wall biosynthesis
MPSLPVVSVGLPVYNGEKYISKAIKSVLDQTFTNFELIICDNHSNDGTFSICSKYQQIDERIRLIKIQDDQTLSSDTSKRQPLPASTNFLHTLQSSVGTYFCWLAHDDFWDPEFLDFCLKHIGNAGGVFPTYCVYDHLTGNTFQRSIPHINSSMKMNDAINTYLNQLCANGFYGLFKTVALRKVAIPLLQDNPFDYMDCMLVFSVIRKFGFNFTEASRPLFYAGIETKYIPKPVDGRKVCINKFNSKVNYLLLLSGDISKIKSVLLAFIESNSYLRHFLHRWRNLARTRY